MDTHDKSGGPVSRRIVHAAWPWAATITAYLLLAVALPTLERAW